MLVVLIAIIQLRILLIIFSSVLFDCLSLNRRYSRIAMYSFLNILSQKIISRMAVLYQEKKLSTTILFSGLIS